MKIISSVILLFFILRRKLLLGDFEEQVLTAKASKGFVNLHQKRVKHYFCTFVCFEKPFEVKSWPFLDSFRALIIQKRFTAYGC